MTTLGSVRCIAASMETRFGALHNQESLTELRLVARYHLTVARDIRNYLLFPISCIPCLTHRCWSELIPALYGRIQEGTFGDSDEASHLVSARLYLPDTT